MRTTLYWLIATALLTLVVHLFIVIFVPGVDTGQKMAQLAAAGEINALHVLESQQTGNALITEANPDLAYAYCAFDLGQRPVEVHAVVPPVYWSISIYSETADNIYTLNDVQAGLATIRLLIVEEEADLPELQAGEEGEVQPENTVVVRSPSKTGLVLLRAFVGDASLANSVRHNLEQSTCFPREPGPLRDS